MGLKLEEQWSGIGRVGFELEEVHKYEWRVRSEWMHFLRRLQC
jgi:hypothetical protein